MTPAFAASSPTTPDATVLEAARLLDGSGLTGRLAGLALLCGLGDSTPALRRQCADILCDYLRSTPAEWDRPALGMAKAESDLRNAVVRALGRRLVPGTSPSWAGTVLDLHHAIFGDHVVLDHAILKGTALFRGAVFTGTASFWGAIFECHTTPEASEKEVDEETGTRDDASVLEDLFTGATFGGAGAFAKATFTGRAQFSGATFHKEADFSDVVFATHAAFVEARFLSGARFAGSRVAENLQLVATHFAQGVDLQAIRVGGWLNLTAASVVGTCDLRSATMEQVCLDEAVLDGPLELEEATISFLEGANVTVHGPLRGRKATLAMGRLHDSWFMADVDLDGARIGGRSGAGEETLDLTGTIFQTDPVAKLAAGSVAPDHPGVTALGRRVTWRIAARARSTPPDDVRSRRRRAAFAAAHGDDVAAVDHLGAPVPGATLEREVVSCLIEFAPPSSRGHSPWLPHVVRWVRRAARDGQEWAVLRMASDFPHDLVPAEESKRWLEQAADGGHLRSAFELAFYVGDRGVDERWLRHVWAAGAEASASPAGTEPDTGDMLAACAHQLALLTSARNAPEAEEWFRRCTDVEPWFDERTGRNRSAALLDQARWLLASQQNDRAESVLARLTAEAFGAARLYRVILDESDHQKHRDARQDRSVELSTWCNACLEHSRVLLRTGRAREAERLVRVASEMPGFAAPSLPMVRAVLAKSAGPSATSDGAYRALDWLVRRYLPGWLVAAGSGETAGLFLAQLSPITDSRSAAAAARLATVTLDGPAMGLRVRDDEMKGGSVRASAIRSVMRTVGGDVAADLTDAAGVRNADIAASRRFASGTRAWLDMWAATAHEADGSAHPWQTAWDQVSTLAWETAWGATGGYLDAGPAEFAGLLVQRWTSALAALPDAGSSPDTDPTMEREWGES